jgi:7,8-didemethyl-8-hydroxy-5-deazariboflavin synthase CofG subunit
MVAKSDRDNRVRDVLCKAAEGEGLTRQEAVMLGGVTGEDLSLMMRAARELTDRQKGKVISFSRNVFIPLTNLCRNRCLYCAFRRNPDDPDAWFMSPDQVLEVSREGARMGCREALFSMGDKPEVRFPEAEKRLRELGYGSTMDYLVSMCRLVLEETPLLPHSNPGVMGERDLKRLKEVNVSLGLMVENTSPRLTLPGGPHENAPDKVPSIRLRTLEQAGMLHIPFTTGILIGIGETWAERVDSLLTLADIQERFGHIQEVIVQNFRAKPSIPMRDHPEPGLEDMLRTLAVARLILGGKMNIQAPPNLSNGDYPRLISAGINDWGGISPVTKDFINPEAPWPHLQDLRDRTMACGYEPRERLAVYPEYIARRDLYLHRALWPRVERSACG